MGEGCVPHGHTVRPSAGERRCDLPLGHPQALLEQKERFMSSVSHELRTPLNGIIGEGVTAKRQAREGMRGQGGPVVGDVDPRWTGVRQPRAAHAAERHHW